MSVVVIAAFVFTSASSKSKLRATKPFIYSAPVQETAPPDLLPSGTAPPRAETVADTVELAFFDFDDGSTPDAQGWVSVDVTAQLDEYFHVADGAELSGGTFGSLLPLEANQSLWCGASPGLDPELCQYATLPGYGNGWEQSWVSSTFDCDSIQFSYKVQWDSEEEYDLTYVEYFDDATSTWTLLPVDAGEGAYDATGSMIETFAIEPPNNTTQLRFRFMSDGAFSDEDGLYASDGAVLIDSLTVECYNDGILSMLLFGNFEGESPGAGMTDDGWWSAQSAPAYGDFAALYPGSEVLQEDPCVVDNSDLWAFVDDPLNTGYDCHVPNPRPDQGAVPFGNEDGLYIDNQVWSPPIPVTGEGGEFILTFRVYRDLPLNNVVAYTWAVRSWENSCPGPWKDFSGGFHYGAQRDFFLYSANAGSLIEPSATHVQIMLGVKDWCGAFCNVYGTGACHSHAPLFDDVRLVRVNTTGPQFVVQQLNLFQDNFAGDGTLTGTARADAAVDILPSASPAILPGDSVAITVYDPDSAIDTDPLSGIGPAVYAYVGVWPVEQAGKTGEDLEATDMRGAIKRFPLVGSAINDGVTWHCYRMDTTFTNTGVVEPDRYCIDLNDAVFVPGDTVCYFFADTSYSHITNYFSREFDGQGEGFATNDIVDVFADPMEFTVLPAGGWRNGGDILYVDDADDRGGNLPVQRFFDSAFENLSISESVDRYDVLSPSSIAGNSLASRVTNVTAQIIDVYKKVIWSSAALSAGLVGDGTGTPSKCDDFGLLLAFLDGHANNPGLFITGDDNAEEWISLIGANAIILRTTFMSFNLVTGDHNTLGEPVTPELVAVSPTFTHAGTPDEIIAYGGCPTINDFDLLQPTGSAFTDFVSTGTTNAYMVSQATTNSASTTARVTLSGFSLHEAGDITQSFPYARAEILGDVLTWLQNILPPATGIEPTIEMSSYLDDNYPNPFNPTTTIRYGIRETGHVSLQVYNAAGQLVKTLVNGEQAPQPGGFKVEWHGESNAGVTIASGVYFYKLVTKDFEKTKKMVLLK
jgi:hypothetical protein